LAAFVELERKAFLLFGESSVTGVMENLTTGEIERALAHVAQAGGFLGASALTPQIVRELEDVIEKVLLKRVRSLFVALKGHG
jgi:hypothetical protein